MNHTIEFLKPHGEEECPDDCHLNSHLGYSDDNYDELANVLLVEVLHHHFSNDDERMLWQILRDGLGKVELPDNPTPVQCIAIGMAYAKALQIGDTTTEAVRVEADKKRRLHSRSILDMLGG